MTTTITRRTELAHRTSGRTPRLLFWNGPTSRATVGVHDARGDDSFEFEVDRQLADRVGELWARQRHAWFR